MTHDPGTATTANATSSPAAAGAVPRPASRRSTQPLPPAAPPDDEVPAADAPERGQPPAEQADPDEPVHHPQQPAHQPEEPAHQPQQPARQAPGQAPDGHPLLAPGAGILAVLALLWLGAMLWSAQAAISSAQFAELALTSAAYALPGTISAGLVGGAGLALGVLNTLSRRPGRGATAAADPTRRLVVSTAAGLLIGLLGAMVVLLAFGDGETVSVVAGTIGAAGTIGGAAAGIRATRVVAAAVAAGLTVFAVGFALNLFEAPLLHVFGAGATQASQASAVGWFALTASVTSGVAAGLVSYAYLRGTGRRTGGAGPRWPAYAAAGAGPGLLLLLSELLARTAGSRVLSRAGALSEADQVAQSLLSGSRINNALIVVFVGAITAIVAVGRNLAPAPEPAENPAPEPAEND